MGQLGKLWATAGQLAPFCIFSLPHTLQGSFREGDLSGVGWTQPATLTPQHWPEEGKFSMVELQAHGTFSGKSHLSWPTQMKGHPEYFLHENDQGQGGSFLETGR